MTTADTVYHVKNPDFRGVKAPEGVPKGFASVAFVWADALGQVLEVTT